MSSKHEVVWFERRGGICLGAVTGGGERKPTVLDEQGARLKLPRSRCLHTLSARLDPASPGELRAHLLELRKAGPEPLEPLLLWSSLEDDVSYTLSELAQLAYGATGDPQLASVVASLSDSASERLAPWFRLVDGSVRRLDPESKERLVERQTRRAATDALHARFLAWYSPWRAAGPPPPSPAQEFSELLDQLREHALVGPGGNTPRGVKRLAAALGHADPDSLLLELERNGVLPPHVNELPYRKGLPRQFPADALEAAELLEELEPTGEDLRHLPTVAIDDADAHEVDDALSAWDEDGTSYIAVHIARVADAISPDGPLEREARRRATSVYFPGESWPMLPAAVSRRFSLRTGAPRPALSLICPVGADGLPGPGRFVASLIEVDEETTYDAAHSGETAELLARLRPVAEALLSKRRSAGAPSVVLRPLRLRLDDEGRPCVSLAAVDDPAYVIVSELMVFYNARLADTLAAAGRRALFRAQPTPLAPITADPEDPLFPLKVRRLMLPTRVGIKPAPQRSMGLEAYTQATSPIRRLGDLIVQRQLLSLLAGDPPAYDARAMEALRQELHPRERRARSLEEERRRYWLCLWLANHEGPLEGVISRDGARPMVYLPELDREFPYVTRERLSVGARVSARVIDAQPRLRTASLGPW